MRVWLLWLVAGLLLAFEYLGVTLLFDGGMLLQRTKWQWFTRLSQLPALLFAMITATILLQRRQLQEIWQVMRERWTMPWSWLWRRWPWLLAHLLCYFLFLVSSFQIFVRGGYGEISYNALYLWIGIWCLLGVFLVLSLAWVILPGDGLRYLVRSLSTPVAVGGSVGVVAWIVGRWGVGLLWAPLGQWTLYGSAALLSMFTDNMIYDPATAALGTNAFAVRVAPVCSGYEGIGLMAVFFSLYLWFRRDALRFPQAFLLLPLSIVLVWLLNIVRITSLILVGAWWSPHIAHGGFHSKAGWLLFCLAALGLVTTSQHLRFFNPKLISIEYQVDVSEEFWNPTAAYLMPLLAVIATTFVAGLFVAEGIDRLYGLRVLAALLMLWWFRSYYRDIHWSWSWTPVVIGVVVFGLWMLLVTPPPISQQLTWQQSLLALPAWEQGGWLVLRVIGGVITVPVIEELAFRGFLLRRIIHADFTEVSSQAFHPMAWLLSSLAFGWLHQAWIAGTLAGLCYAFAQSVRGRVSDAIIAHAVTNGLIALYVLTTGRWWLWM